MGSLIKKLKAALGIGSIWGIAFGAVGAALGALIPMGSFVSSVLAFGVGFGVAGLILGAGFGGLLSVMEGRRTLDELTAHRAALWGFVVGAAVALVGTIAVASLTDVVKIAGSLLGLPIPIALQLTALAAGAVSPSEPLPRGWQPQPFRWRSGDLRSTTLDRRGPCPTGW